MLVTLNCDGFVQSRDVFQENGGSPGIHKVARNPLFLKLRSLANIPCRTAILKKISTNFSSQKNINGDGRGKLANKFTPCSITVASASVLSLTIEGSWFRVNISNMQSGFGKIAIFCCSVRRRVCRPSTVQMFKFYV